MLISRTLLQHISTRCDLALSCLFASQHATSCRQCSCIVSVFPGDTLFALGCGRMFEGNAQQMWTSLSKLKPLPPATKVFCAHEYTQSNAKFALSIDPDNQTLQKRAALINDLRKQVGTCLLWFYLKHLLCLRHVSKTEILLFRKPLPACLAELDVLCAYCWPTSVCYDSTVGMPVLNWGDSAHLV